MLDAFCGTSIAVDTPTPRLVVNTVLLHGEASRKNNRKRLSTQHDRQKSLKCELGTFLEVSIMLTKSTACLVMNGCNQKGVCKGQPQSFNTEKTVKKQGWREGKGFQIQYNRQRDL